MIRTVQAIGLLALAAVGGICADQEKPVKLPPPPKAPAKAAAPKGGTPKMGPRPTNPASQAARLYQLSPAERERALEKLPPAQQERLRANLKWYDGLPKDQQQAVVQRAERLAALPPKEQQEFQRQFRALQQLPPERRQMVNQALRRLQVMSEADRVVRLNSPAFKDRFTPEELHMIDKLSEVLLPPL
ncbi:MAG: DUF3106 domain-containing protein [Bryobacteraceae bacterium]